MPVSESSRQRHHRHSRKLPFDHAARFGYLGTSYAGLLKGGVRAGSTVLILGVTGTLGVGAVLLALAMGATKILGVARNVALLERVKALAPDRISVLSYGSEDLGHCCASASQGPAAPAPSACSR